MFKNVLKFICRQKLSINSIKIENSVVVLRNFHKYQRDNGDNRSFENGKSVRYFVGYTSAFSIMSIFRKKNPEEVEEESEIVKLLKRSILCIQKKEYDKAEQMLHIALKVAQEFQDKNGITYVLDEMANLAYEVGNYQKAEKLFVNVMQRLLSDGVKEDDIKIIHMSGKIAQMAAVQNNQEKAFKGFEWTISKIESNAAFREDSELYELWGLVKNWHAQSLMQASRFQEAKKAFLEAYEVFLKFHDEVSDEGVQLMNNLGVVYTELNEYDLAEKFLLKAVDISSHIPDFADAGIYHANLGLVYFRRGLYERARQFCSHAWKWGRRNNSDESMTQATYCLDQIKKAQIEHES